MYSEMRDKITGFVPRLIGSTVSWKCKRTLFITPTPIGEKWCCFGSTGINDNSDLYPIILKKCCYFLFLHLQLFKLWLPVLLGKDWRKKNKLEELLLTILIVVFPCPSSCWLPPVQSMDSGSEADSGLETGKVITTFCWCGCLQSPVHPFFISFDCRN